MSPSHRILVALAVASSVGAIGLRAAPAAACKCLPDKRSTDAVYLGAIADAHLAFEGKVVATRHAPGKAGRMLTTFQVARYYKGWPDARVVVETAAKPRHMCDRAHKFERGQTYLVFAKREGKHYAVANASSCQKSATGPVPKDVKLHLLFPRARRPGKATQQDWRKLYQQLVERICPFGHPFVVTRPGCTREPCDYDCSDDGRGTAGKKRMIGE